MAYQSATIYPNSDAGHTLNGQSSWANARNGTTSGIVTTIATTNVYATFSNVRGSASYGVARYFAAFDISASLPYGAAIMSATANIWYSAIAGADRLVKHNTTSSLNTTGTFDSCRYVSGGDNSQEDMFSLSAEYTPSSTSGYTSITLNEQALTDIKAVSGTSVSNSGMFCLAVIKETDYDFQAPTDGISHKSIVHTDAYTGTSRDPKIIVMYEEPQPIWFGANF